MWIQKSFQEEKPSLYVVPTPIGNLEDITFRAVKTLETVSLIAAEDTRQTKKLLNHFNIDTRLISYHEHSNINRDQEIIEKIKGGQSIALVSDAGMPAISDPGYRLIQLAINEQINIVVLPGANAALCALVGSGLTTDEFLFYGFLPRQTKEKQNEIERLNNLKSTLIFYESPHRLKQTLQFLYKNLGNRQIAIAREITKMYEEIIRGSLKDIVDWSKNETFKGELCLIVDGSKDEISKEDTLWWSHLSILQHVNHYETEENLRTNEAIKRVANDRAMKRQDVYKVVHVD